MSTVATGGMLGLLYDAIGNVDSFLTVFVYIYSLLILAYIITMWVRLPYSVWLNRVQRFLYDVCDPYLRLFRKILSPLGLTNSYIGLILAVTTWWDIAHVHDQDGGGAFELSVPLAVSFGQAFSAMATSRHCCMFLSSARRRRFSETAKK